MIVAFSASVTTTHDRETNANVVSSIASLV